MKWQDLLNLFQRDTTITLADIVVALGFALVCSVVIVLMYNYFYGRQNVGAGVQRSFLLMGPAITALFLGIQFSLPLSLGLLGALSIVRFRTPVKDPAEIGFVMLLIAASIGSAIFNYLLVGILFAIAIIALIGHKLARGYSGGGRGTLIITFGSPEDIVQEARLTAFIKSKLRGVKLENVSTQADSASLNYQYSRRKGIELGMFTRELSDTAAPAKVSIYIG
jgi:hypothetical protein